MKRNRCFVQNLMMKIENLLWITTIQILLVLLAVSFIHSLKSKSIASDENTFKLNEEAYRANNLGVAFLEQYKHKEGAEEFRRALNINPNLTTAKINLCIALFYTQDLDGAQQVATDVLNVTPNAPQPHFILGLIARSQNRVDDAFASFQRVLEIDSRDVASNINIGQLYVSQKKYDEAEKTFRRSIELEPYNTTALYNLATVLNRTGKRDEGKRLLQKFQELKQSGAGVELSATYLEQGRYAEAIASTGMEEELVDKNPPSVVFIDATKNIFQKPNTTTSNFQKNALGQIFKSSQWNESTKRKLVQSLGGVATLFDFETDGDLDLIQLTATGQKLFRNDNGKFIDITKEAGDLSKASRGIGIGVVAGDFDHDSKTDLFVLRYGSNSLYRNEGNGKFSDVTTKAKIPNYPFLSISVAMADVDHDGDLDIFIAGLADISKNPFASTKNKIAFFPNGFPAAPNMLLRNNGNGTFTDVSSQAKIISPTGHAVSVVATDYDNRRDVDLFVLNYGDTPTLFRNMRDSTFRNVADEVLRIQKRNYSALAVCDYNKDGFTDFFFGVFATSDGRGGFVLSTSPKELSNIGNVSAAQFVDYDNDGLVDLVLITDKGLRIVRNLGIKNGSPDDFVRGAKWQLIQPQNDILPDISSSRFVASGDVDNDGDEDFFARSSDGSLKFIRNDGGNRNRSSNIRLAGKVSNRSGIGAKIDMRAGSLTQKLETYSSSPAPAPADLLFGLGQREKPDTVRVIWTSGIVQSETEIVSAKTTNVIEIDRKPSSCPFLYTWNGERFEFITDFMGGGEMAYWQGYGKYNHPDPDEYVRITSDKLKPKNGHYEIRVTNELEEVLYVDRLQLIAVDHPVETEVYPNEGLANPTSSKFILYTTRNTHAPLSAVDENGKDVLAKLKDADRNFVDTFRLHKIQGFAEPHTLTLSLDDKKGFKGRTLLLMNGWTDYAFSSDNVAASQTGMSLQFPSLQVKDEKGKWKTVIENIGIPVGRPQTMTVDLTGKFLSDSREVRIVTNMRVYWDKISVDTSDDKSPVEMTRLEPVSADLRWRGYSEEVSPDGREPFSYDYSKVNFTSPWKVFTGTFTHQSDVRELLSDIDDVFVISRTGDEISLSFDANELPALKDGWTRTFLLYSFGYSKEMSINSGSPDVVFPLPFRAMTKYPYDSTEKYPMTLEKEKLFEKYNTRIVTRPIAKVF
jgi:tetratricopeptide (TPR) repeat protein